MTKVDIKGWKTITIKKERRKRYRKWNRNNRERKDRKGDWVNNKVKMKQKKQRVNVQKWAMKAQRIISQRGKEENRRRNKDLSESS